MQRPGEDVGESLHPWGMTGCRYASERDGPDGRSSRSTTPSRRTHSPSSHPVNDTREASRLSDLPPHRGALHPAQRSPEAERNALGLPLGGQGERRRGLREPADGAEHEQGPEATPVLSDLLGP